MYAVISDVHANLEALKSVLKDIKGRNIRSLIFLGDAVGYGPDPDECIRMLSSECGTLIAGNHDCGACGLTAVDLFNENARAAIEWTKRVISDEDLGVLRSFPVSAEDKEKDATFVHASPFEPEQWHYLLTSSDAEMNFGHFQTGLCFVGHSHRPFIIEKTLSGELILHKGEASFKPGSRYIINTGSVGQPRDMDPRAAYAVVGGGKVSIIRVSYDVGAVQKKMLAAGLPAPLIERLELGM